MDIDMWTWIVRLKIGNGGLNCEQSSVTLDQINDGYNCDLLELSAFKNSWLHGVAYYNIYYLGH